MKTIIRIKHLLLPVLIAFCVLYNGCATTTQHIATVTYNPVKEWDASKKLFALPFHTDNIELKQIESKLCRITNLLGSYGGLQFVDEMNQADLLLYISISSDTVKYSGAGYISGGNSSYSYYNNLLKGFITTSSQRAVIVPPSEKINYYGNVALWCTEKSSKFELEKVIYVSHDSEELYSRDPLVSYFFLTGRCISAINGINRKELNRTPLLGINVYTNSLSGITVIPYKRGDFNDLRAPFQKKRCDIQDK